jgi:hypothetical protein
MILSRAASLALAVASAIAVTWVATPAKAEWGHHHRHWQHGHWQHRPAWGWAPGYYYRPPPVYYAPPPVVYAPPPPPYYYSPGVSFGMTFR